MSALRRWRHMSLLIKKNKYIKQTKFFLKKKKKKKKLKIEKERDGCPSPWGWPHAIFFFIKKF
jgi:hypothetical protein